MKVVPVTIGALAPTNDMLASVTWRDPARPDTCGAPSMMRQRPWTRPVPRLFLAPATGCSLPSSGGLVSCSGVEFPDLPGGTGQVGVIHQRRRVPLFGL
jgi:hypothetical protein